MDTSIETSQNNLFNLPHCEGNGLSSSTDDDCHFLTNPNSMHWNSYNPEMAGEEDSDSEMPAIPLESLELEEDSEKENRPPSPLPLRRQQSKTFGEESLPSFTQNTPLFSFNQLETPEEKRERKFFVALRDFFGPLRYRWTQQIASVKEYYAPRDGHIGMDPNENASGAMTNILNLLTSEETAAFFARYTELQQESPWKQSDAAQWDWEAHPIEAIINSITGIRMLFDKLDLMLRVWAYVKFKMAPDAIIPASIGFDDIFLMELCKRVTAGIGEDYPEEWKAVIMYHQAIQKKAQHIPIAPKVSPSN